ncbi:hypothetical protein [Cardinium endosymbiont of Sogatella furcifera]|uniref:hypothetical protein n=1 Tax=Cardinium endosymbiont of Sogatella furcifera TaxID=650378 RepID=UPI0013B3669D|nr:hypothetical protein [Cardinium endosymbiont of Sogatella furcifera]
MNANNFKVLLCCYTIGIAGCNKIGNPSYMDSGGDGTSEKRQDVKASSSAVQSGSIDCDRLLQHSLNVIKRRADTSERVAISQQKAADRAIQDAANARRTADMARKTADDREKARLELGGGDALCNDKLLQHSLNVIKRRADTSERVAISQQKAADRAIQDAANARRTADMARKTADDREKARLELGGGDTLPAVGMMSKTDDDREKESRLKLGAGGDVL